MHGGYTFTREIRVGVVGGAPVVLRSRGDLFITVVLGFLVLVVIYGSVMFRWRVGTLNGAFSTWARRF